MHQRVTKKVNVQTISQRAAKVCICASACNKGKSLYLCIIVQQKKKCRSKCIFANNAPATGKYRSNVRQQVKNRKQCTSVNPLDINFNS